MTVNNYEGNVSKYALGSKAKTIVVGVSLAAITVCGLVMHKTIRRDINQLWTSITQKDYSQDARLNANANDINENKNYLYVVDTNTKNNRANIEKNTSSVVANKKLIDVIQEDITYLYRQNDSLFHKNNLLVEVQENIQYHISTLEDEISHLSEKYERTRGLFSRNKRNAYVFGGE